MGTSCSRVISPIEQVSLLQSVGHAELTQLQSEINYELILNKVVRLILRSGTNALRTTTVVCCQASPPQIVLGFTNHINLACSGRLYLVDTLVIKIKGVKLALTSEMWTRYNNITTVSGD